MLSSRCSTGTVTSRRCFMDLLPLHSLRFWSPRGFWKQLSENRYYRAGILNSSVINRKQQKKTWALLKRTQVFCLRRHTHHRYSDQSYSLREPRGNVASQSALGRIKQQLEQIFGLSALWSQHATQKKNRSKHRAHTRLICWTETRTVCAENALNRAKRFTKQLFHTQNV